jgi:hypothetical protein
MITRRRRIIRFWCPVVTSIRVILAFRTLRWIGKRMGSRLNILTFLSQLPWVSLDRFVPHQCVGLVALRPHSAIAKSATYNIQLSKYLDATPDALSNQLLKHPDFVLAT